MTVQTDTTRRRIERRRPPPAPPAPTLVGESAAFRAMMLHLDALLARDPRAILLAGESGTGRSLMAKEYHRRSRRRRRPFHVLSCGSLPAGILEEELFGTADENYPGVLRSGTRDTVLLEEADRLPTELAARLDTWFRSSCPGAPILLLSVRPMEPPVSGALTTGPVSALPIPPLRQRGADVELLARLFLRGWAVRRDRRLPVLEDETIDALHGHPWPGNLRELRDAMERAAETAPGPFIRAEHLQVRSRSTLPIQGRGAAAAEMIRIPAHGKKWEDVEAEVVRATLRITGGNRSQASRILGISRPTLTRKIRRYGAEDEGLA